MGKNNDIICLFSLLCRGVREICVGFCTQNWMRRVKKSIFLREPNSRLLEARANLYISRLCINSIAFIHSISVKAEVP